MKKNLLLIILPMFLLAACGNNGGGSSSTTSVPSTTSSEPEPTSQEQQKITLAVKIKVTNLQYDFVYEGAEEFMYWKVGDNYMEEFTNIYSGNAKTSYYYKKDADGKYFVYQFSGAIKDIASSQDWGSPKSTKVPEEIAAGNTSLFTVEQTHTYPVSTIKENVTVKVDGTSTSLEATKYVASSTGTELHWISNSQYDLVAKQHDSLGKSSKLVSTDSTITQFPTSFIPE